MNAEQVIEIYEKKYLDDKRPRQAIKAAKAFIKDPSDKNKKAAYAANAAMKKHIIEYGVSLLR